MHLNVRARNGHTSCRGYCWVCTPWPEKLLLIIPATIAALQPLPSYNHRCPATAAALQPQMPCNHPRPYHHQHPSLWTYTLLPPSHRSFRFRFWLSQSMAANANSLALVCSSGLWSWLIHTPLTLSINDLGCTYSNRDAINDPTPPLPITPATFTLPTPILQPSPATFIPTL